MDELTDESLTDFDDNLNPSAVVEYLNHLLESVENLCTVVTALTQRVDALEAKSRSISSNVSAIMGEIYES